MTALSGTIELSKKDKEKIFKEFYNRQEMALTNLDIQIGAQYARGEKIYFYTNRKIPFFFYFTEIQKTKDFARFPGIYPALALYVHKLEQSREAIEYIDTKFSKNMSRRLIYDTASQRCTARYEKSIGEYNIEAEITPEYCEITMYYHYDCKVAKLKKQLHYSNSMGNVYFHFELFIVDMIKEITTSVFNKKLFNE